MNANNLFLPWGEKQLKEIESKTLDSVATEVSEILWLYNEELEEKEKDAIKKYLESWKLDEEKYSDSFNRVKEIIDNWSDSIKEYCLIKINTQDELYKELTEEEK